MGTEAPPGPLLTPSPREIGPTRAQLRSTPAPRSTPVATVSIPAVASQAY